MAQTQRLGDLLLEAGAITQEQLGNALAEQKKSGERLGAFLVSKGWITESKLMEALSLLLKFPLVSLSRYRPSPEALRKIPIKLDRTQLPDASDRVLDFNIDLRPVESSFTLNARIRNTALIERRRELSFRR